MLLMQMTVIVNAMFTVFPPIMALSLSASRTPLDAHRSTLARQ